MATFQAAFLQNQEIVSTKSVLIFKGYLIFRILLLFVMHKAYIYLSGIIATVEGHDVILLLYCTAIGSIRFAHFHTTPCYTVYKLLSVCSIVKSSLYIILQLVAAVVLLYIGDYLIFTCSI